MESIIAELYFHTWIDPFSLIGNAPPFYFLLYIVKEDTLNILRPLIATWIQLHFGGNPKALVALVTHLILKSTRGPNALEILMNGCKTWNGTIGPHARMLLSENF